jgi:hypothetical protein
MDYARVSRDPTRPTYTGKHSHRLRCWVYSKLQAQKVYFILLLLLLLLLLYTDQIFEYEYNYYSRKSSKKSMVESILFITSAAVSDFSLVSCDFLLDS